MRFFFKFITIHLFSKEITLREQFERGIHFVLSQVRNLSVTASKVQMVIIINANSVNRDLYRIHFLFLLIKYNFT